MPASVGRHSQRTGRQEASIYVGPEGGAEYEYSLMYKTPYKTKKRKKNFYESTSRMVLVPAVGAEKNRGNLEWHALRRRLLN